MGERFGGRQKGTPNKATADVKAAFAKHGQELVDAVLELCRHDDPNVRLRAVGLALDRWLGRAPQHVDVDASVAVSRIERIIVDARPVDQSILDNDEPKQLTH
jgi:hypothetical protein